MQVYLTCAVLFGMLHGKVYSFEQKQNVLYSPQMLEFYSNKSDQFQFEFHNRDPVDYAQYSNTTTLGLEDLEKQDDVEGHKDDFSYLNKGLNDTFEFHFQDSEVEDDEKDDYYDMDTDVDIDDEDDEAYDEYGKLFADDDDEDDNEDDEDEEQDDVNDDLNVSNPVSTPVPAPNPPVTSGKFDYRTQKINGVNLGGWLVTEPFISPSLYEQASVDGSEARTPIDEYNFCKSLGPNEALARLRKHWDTWITEADFIRIKSYGFNAVRLPIGYWAFAKLADDPYVSGQEEYLIKAINWCRAHGLKLWVDLHGIPGSQNGFDNSGQRDVYQWMNPTNYELGLKVLQYIYDKYGGVDYEDVIIGYQNLNEPLHDRYEIPKIIEFDQTTYKMFREKSNNWFVYHDAFLPAPFWSNFMNEPEYKDTVLDHHRYEVFDPTQLRESIDGHITSIKLLVGEFLRLPKIQIVGEWSAALTDCCKWLNGVGRGARYDNSFAGTGVIGQCRFSNDFTKMTAEDKVNTRRIIEAQLDIYNQTNGFFYWTWKTENAIEWSMSDLANIGLFPVPLHDRKYPRVV